MWIENPIVKEDLDQICENCEKIFKELDGKTILVTGATGLIGHTLVNALLYRNLLTKNGPRVIAMVRNPEKAERMYQSQKKACPDRLGFLIGDALRDLKIEPQEPVDYIVHAASQTSSKGFIDAPVETIETSFQGTRSVLQLAKRQQVKKLVFLSTMEIYGYPEEGHKVTEEETGALSPLTLRNCYPLSKQLCENLCCAFASEYKVPVCILRLTQTFGPGVSYQDGRVFAEFARSVMEHRDIILKTEGKTRRSYLYTADAVSAILTALLRAEAGKAYNVANENTYCSILEMAEKAAELGSISVRMEPADTKALGYANTLYMDLDTSAMRKLGWKPTRDLKEMFSRMIGSMNGK